MIDSQTPVAVSPFLDLAPSIYRQRLVIEGYPEEPIGAEQIVEYLTRLSTCLDMTTLIEPVSHCSDKYGWAGWIHWECSGAHFYAWERPTLFFSVDIYTCKGFRPEDAERFTRDYFHARKLVTRAF